MKVKNNIMFVLSIVLVIMSFYCVTAVGNNEPQGPDVLSLLNSGRYNDQNNSMPITAEAGNVSALLITDVRSTQSWQGYYGNVTGRITLDDASNNTFYSWDIVSPTGEIYATNVSSGIQWAYVACLNYTATGDPAVDGQTMNLISLENTYWINATDKDGFNETFNQTYTCGGASPCFKVGGVETPTGKCPMTTTYVNEAAQTTSFKEVLMQENNSGALLFVALLESNQDGFKATTDAHDFQMLVAENGHPGYESTTTTYYFYVELA